MKYMVMVNGKYMTQVEVEGSALSAEHYLLNDVRYGIESAQAFTDKEMKTDYFIGLMQHCQLITINEIIRMSEFAKKRTEHEIKSIKDLIARVDEQIEELNSQKKELERQLNKAKCSSGEAL